MGISIKEILKRSTILNWIKSSTDTSKNEIDSLEKITMLNEQKYEFDDIFANFIQLVLESDDIKTTFYDFNMNDGSDYAMEVNDVVISFDLIHNYSDYTFRYYVNGRWTLDKTDMDENGTSNRSIDIIEDHVSKVLRYTTFTADPSWFPKFKSKVIDLFGDEFVTKKEVMDVLEEHKLIITGFTGTLRELEQEYDKGITVEPAVKDMELGVPKASMSSIIIGNSANKWKLIRYIQNGIGDTDHTFIPLDKGTGDISHGLLIFIDDINIKIKALEKDNTNLDSKWRCILHMIYQASTLSDEILSEIIDDAIFAIFSINPQQDDLSHEKLFDEFF